MNEEMNKKTLYILTEITDSMPTGWVKSFGKELCIEVITTLIEVDKLLDYEIFQIKEKFGELRWYGSDVPELQPIIDKYTNRSRYTCACCGKPATRVTTKGWHSPFCDTCLKNHLLGPKESMDNISMPVTKYWKNWDEVTSLGKS